MENFLVTMRDLFVGVLLGVYEDGKGEREKKKERSRCPAKRFRFNLAARIVWDTLCKCAPVVALVARPGNLKEVK